MKHRLLSCLITLGFLAQTLSAADGPLRVFIRAGVKTHGPQENGYHDHPRFLGDWTQLLTERGAKVGGAMRFPTGEELAKTDVLITFAADAATIEGQQRKDLEAFLGRGGGFVVIHDAVVGNDPDWFKTVVGGAWRNGKAKWLHGEVDFYTVDKQHPITRGVSNFRFSDEIYYELDMDPAAQVLATSFHDVYTIAPQMWVYEKADYRAAVFIPGHRFETFQMPHTRALVLRSIAWAGKRDADLFLVTEERNSLRYPPGGPLPPDQAASKIELPGEFTVSLVAAEPDVTNPIAIDWDPANRLWVAETPEYPSGRRINPDDNKWAVWRSRNPGEYQGEKENRPARDRISILEDTNGDGRTDRKKVFYDGLELVTGMVHYRDGVIVSQAPDIYWLRDTDGDDRADKKITLYTGLGIRDSHAVINNLRWGFDGWIYATHGYSADKVRSPDGKKDFGTIGSGVLRFRPDGSRIEQVASKNGNTWGMTFTWDNELIFTQPTSGSHLHHVILSEQDLLRGRVPGITSYKILEDHKESYPTIKYSRPAYVQIDQVGMFTAAAGSCFYNGGAWPGDWENSHFVTEPTINIVHRDVLWPDGVSYVAKRHASESQKEFIAGVDMWFRPVGNRIGPDGALYLLDWYNQAAIHNDTRRPPHGANNAAVRPDRDHFFGRIWRVQHKQARKLNQPNLVRADVAGRVAALSHPNMTIRRNAHRLLSEAGDADSLKAVRETLASPSAVARIHAGWILHNREALTPADVQTLLAAREPAVRKNALKLAAELPETGRGPLGNALQAALKGKEPQLKLQALRALQTQPWTDDLAHQAASAWPDLQDPWLQSAALGVAARDPLASLTAALNAPQAGKLADYVSRLAAVVAEQGPELAGQSVIRLAGQAGVSRELRTSYLNSLGETLRPNQMPAWNAKLAEALGHLVTGKELDVASAALPLLVRWDKDRQLAAQVAPVLQRMRSRLTDRQAPAAERTRLVARLIDVQQLDTEILPTATSLLAATDETAEIKQAALNALGASNEAAVGRALVKVYPRLDPEIQEPAMEQILKRGEWSLAFLDAVEAETIDHENLTPVAIHRLRTHPQLRVARKANDLIDRLRGPEMKEKEAVLVKLGPAVENGGNAAKGKETFTLNCAVCHQFNGEGKDIGPNLTGMGAHGREELLGHIVDPNRAVEPNYIAVSITTKDGESYDGIVAQENRRQVVLRGLAGDQEIEKKDIQRRRSTGLSLMPNGFEALGEDGMRDLLAYLTVGADQFRYLDLKDAATADTRGGLYARNSRDGGGMELRKYGNVANHGVPFFLLDPAKSPSGRNVIVLKGGPGEDNYSKTLPQKVEIPVGTPALRLHFLGGVGGWAFPWRRSGEGKTPVVKATIHYAGGQTESHTFHDGTEFADYIRQIDVPGSAYVPGLVDPRQVRYHAIDLKRRDKVEKLVLESFDNYVAPTILAITAEVKEGPARIQKIAAAAAAPAPRPAAQKKGKGKGKKAQPAAPLAAGKVFRWGPGIKTLIVGGHASHDFPTWFNAADSKLLKSAGASVHYTDNPNDIAPNIDQVQVLVLTLNQPIADAATHRAIEGYAKQGKGLVLVHACLWYNWKNWPEYNRDIAGGGTRRHDRLGDYEVRLNDTPHPVVEGVPTSFRITDELYHYNHDPEGTPITVLATAHSRITDQDHPQVFLVNHPQARIVGITLGHDGDAHNHPAYQRLLTNALKWAAGH